MSQRRTGPLREAIEAAFPERPFAIRLWDGSGVEATGNGGPTIELRSPRALGYLLRAPGQLGLGRAYVTGEIDVDDLDAAVAMLGRWDAPPLRRRMKARLGAAMLRAAGPQRLPGPPTAELRPRGRRHSRGRDAAGVRHHYDVSNEFFALFLDESMTYSCALFEREDMTLEEAQAAKLELACRKLELEPGQRLLDIGCGWGSLAIHAAREHGVSVLGITLSAPQAALARKRVAAAGASDQVEIEVTDYRDLGAGSFDAVASIGMIEHVGESRVDKYARGIARVLRDGGRALNHGICMLPARPRGAHLPDAFTTRYVFPDGELLNLSRMLRALEGAGFETLHVEDLHTDYAETLRHWNERLESRLEEAERLAGTERLRVWRLYLRTARNGFEIGRNAVYQVLSSRPLREPAIVAPGSSTAAESGELRRRRIPAPRAAA
jgi:cyclopropane-fatty-acyl-phospholipid synthase